MTVPADIVRTDQSRGQFSSGGFEQVLGGLEGVCVHNNKVLISTPIREAHDATLHEVLARLHMGNDRVQSCKCTFGQQGVPFLSHIPPGATAYMSLHHQHMLHWPPALLARLHSCTTAPLWLIAWLLCHAAVLCLLQTPTMAISLQMQSAHQEDSHMIMCHVSVLRSATPHGSAATLSTGSQHVHACSQHVQPQTALGWVAPHCPHGDRGTRE